MAYFSHISTFHSISPNKFHLSFPSFLPHKLNYPTISACAIKKSPRASRKLKSDADLCNDIREFVLAVGLPEDHLPSLKELSQHGRQDLANIVRRRGYKVMKELLAVSTGTSMYTSDLEKISSEIEEGFHDSEGQNEKSSAPAGDVSLSRSLGTMENHKGIEMERNLESSHENYATEEASDDEPLQQKMSTLTENGSQSSILKDKMISLSDDVYWSNSTAIRTDLNSDDQSYINPEASSYSALKEKASNFIYNGQLDIIEDSGFAILSKTSSEGSAITKSGYDLTSRDSKDFISSADGTELSIGNYKLPFQQFEDATVDGTLSRNDSPSLESHSTSDHCEDPDVEAEVARLKFILHQKEMELTQLKQEIEKEKLALSHLQTKAEMEINKAQQLISEKDAELQAAEESLSGLKEAEIQYLGDGEVVEVCGSFNGWHECIKMDPNESSNILDSAGSRFLLPPIE